MKQQPRHHSWMLLLVCLLLSLTSLSIAQQTLADGDWFERQLADGVVWRHYLFDTLFGSKQSVSYVDADLNNPNVSVEFPYLASSRQRTSSMVPAQFSGAASGINGTYFDTTGTGGHRTYLRIDNSEIPPGSTLFSPWGYEGAIALDASDNASIEEIPTGGWVNDTTHPSILACGPLLIVDGTIPSAHLTAIGSHCTSRHPRSAIGITSDNHLILLVADGRTDKAAGMTCEELANVMAQLGCPDAMNLDGGGSTTLWGRGELYSGVLNYPSDNGLYDHLGERACSNAVAIIAPAVTPAPWDGRLTAKSFTQTMETGSSQLVSFTYQNIGTETWTAADTTLVTTRPSGRSSEFSTDAGWVSSSQPVAMSPSTVATGATATFTFTLKAPDLSSIAVYDEYFELQQNGIGRIGPTDSEAWMQLVVEPPPSGGASFIVESRIGGMNYSWYTDSGMADAGANCTAAGATGDIGTRYGSTYRSVAGFKSATITPDFPQAGPYNVYVAWGNGSNRRSPITYKVTDNAGTTTFQIDQTQPANIWYRIGTEPFEFAAGTGGTVVMTNEDIDVSGSMYTGAFKFEFVGATVCDWYLY